MPVVPRASAADAAGNRNTPARSDAAIDATIGFEQACTTALCVSDDDRVAMVSRKELARLRRTNRKADFRINPGIDMTHAELRRASGNIIQSLEHLHGPFQHKEFLKRDSPEDALWIAHINEFRLPEIPGRIVRVVPVDAEAYRVSRINRELIGQRIGLPGPVGAGLSSSPATLPPPEASHRRCSRSRNRTGPCSSLRRKDTRHAPSPAAPLADPRRKEVLPCKKAGSQDRNRLRRQAPLKLGLPPSSACPLNPSTVPLRPAMGTPLSVEDVACLLGQD